MYRSLAFHSAEFYLFRAGIKNNIYTFCYLNTLWKAHIFLSETQKGMKTHCLSHNNKSKTR